MRNEKLAIRIEHGEEVDQLTDIAPERRLYAAILGRAFNDLKSPEIKHVKSAYTWFTSTSKKYYDTFVTYKEIKDTLFLSVEAIKMIDQTVEEVGKTLT